MLTWKPARDDPDAVNRGAPLSSIHSKESKSPQVRSMFPRRTLLTASAVAAATIALPRVFAQAKLEKTRISVAVGGKAAVY